MEHEFDQWIGVASAVMCVLYEAGMVKRAERTTFEFTSLSPDLTDGNEI